MESSKRKLRYATIDLIHALLAYAVGMGCVVLGLWIAHDFFGIEINRSLDLSEDRGLLFGIFLAVIVGVYPLVTIAYGSAFLLIKPFLGAETYERIVREKLTSLGTGPLRRLLLGASNSNHDAA